MSLINYRGPFARRKPPGALSSRASIRLRRTLPLALLSLAWSVALLSGCGKSSSHPPSASAPPAVNDSKDPWQLSASSPFGNYGGYLGNGYLGMRFGASGTTDSPDGRSPANAPPTKGSPLLCIVSGLYSGENLVPAPNWGSLQFETQGVVAQPESGNVTNYRQTLDMKNGELLTTYRFPGSHPVVQVELTTRVHRDIPHLVTLAARVIPLADGELSVRNPMLQADPAYYESIGGGKAVPNAALQLKLKNSLAPANQYLTLAERLEALNKNGDVVQGNLGSRDGVRTFPLKARDPLFLTKWIYVAASPDYDARSLEKAQKALDDFQALGHQALVESHRASWAKIWNGDIQIDGDMEAQQAVRSSLFALLCSVRPGAKWSIPPMGLSGVQWGGHIFWDADTWMFPVLALLHPDLAKTIVDYRYDTLNGALYNAKKNGYQGADFATESAVTGKEMAPAEYPFHDHFSADVAIAQWKYYLLTGDRERLKRKAYPILKAVAEYYRSRAVYNKAKDRYEIRHVISPDETAHFVDNDVYTNADASMALQCAIRASETLNLPYPPAWRTIATKLWLPFDKARQRYLEHEGYQKTRRPPKQADAELIFFPLGIPASKAITANTLSFYASQISAYGPAMTSSVHAVIAARLAGQNGAGEKPSAGGTPDELSQALDYFRQSYRPFLRPPFNDFSEKRTTDNATFLTGCAGALMGPVFGFGGIDYDASGLKAAPHLPPKWKRLRIRGIHYKNHVYELDVTPGGKPSALRKTQ
jgi:trehalose/maltose hydrolase-like predicted phosphorylase